MHRQQTAASTPVTWTGLIRFMRVAWSVLKGGKLGDVEARALFETRLLGRPHHGAASSVALRKRRSRRDEIGHRSVHKWICAALEVVLDPVGPLNPKLDPAEFWGEGIITIPLESLAVHLPADADLETIGDRLQFAAEAFDELCCEAKRRASRAGRGGKRARAPASAPTATRVREWLDRHPRIHWIDDAAFVHERFDQICETIDRLIKAGAAAPLARIVPLANHYLHLFEQHDLRARASRIVSTEARDGLARLPEATRLLTLIEGEGWVQLRRDDRDALHASILTPEVLNRDLPEALRRARASGDITEIRRAIEAQCVFYRLSAVIATDPEQALADFEHSIALARTARNESLEISIAIDVAELQAKQGRREEAATRLLRAQILAEKHGNHRRLFRALCVQALLAVQRGDPRLANADLRRAEATLDSIHRSAQTVLTRPAKRNWYQPGYRDLLDSVKAAVESYVFASIGSEAPAENEHE